MWSNYHTHSHYCDGKGKILDYLQAAKKEGIAQLGISSHAPLPFSCKWCMKRDAFPDYLREIDAASQAYPELEVYKGLEVDYIPGIVSPAVFAADLDFTIGSIHFAGQFEQTYWEIDNTLEVFRLGLAKIFQDNIRAAVSHYYDLTREMIVKSPPNILGHMDKIKINAGAFFSESEPWYVNEIDQTLKALRETNIIVEVNTRGLYKKKSDSTYPSPWILERILSLKIPVTLSSDAHHPDDIIREFPNTYTLLQDIGFKQISILRGGIWKKMSLDAYGTRH